MHCPENVDGSTYIELVAAVSIILSKNLSPLETFILAEFMQSVSIQLFTLGAFKDAEEAARIARERARLEKEERENKGIK
jgi:hypothetical protein